MDRCEENRVDHVSWLAENDVLGERNGIWPAELLRRLARPLSSHRGFACAIFSGLNTRTMGYSSGDGGLVMIAMTWSVTLTAS
jgi:hypothetical protein